MKEEIRADKTQSRNMIYFVFNNWRVISSKAASTFTESIADVSIKGIFNLSAYS